jgi:hypothetical protein
MILNPLGDEPREEFAVNCQGTTCGQGGSFCTLKQHGTENSRFVFEQAGGPIGEIRAERI